MKQYIEIKSARIHNLKNIDIRIPKNKLTVITGVSGSGKSSLAFDTLYEEGKRRYLLFSGTHFSADKGTHFDTLTGLSPTVAVEQRTIRQANPRSTVGTRTKIGNLLAALFAVYGKRDKKHDDGKLLPMEMFQKNSPKGMCVKCLGTGMYYEIDEDAIIRPEIAIKDLFDGFMQRHRFYRKHFKKFCEEYHIDITKPIGSLTDDVLDLFKYGCDKTGFVGASTVLDFLHKHAMGNRLNEENKVDWKGIQSQAMPCPKCQGSGLGEYARHTTLNGKTITELERMYIKDLITFIHDLKGKIAVQFAINQILAKLTCMHDVGLKHLSLSRPVPTLSGGEIQRLFLAAFIVAEMDSIIFVLDEPTIGLHEVEKKNLIGIVKGLIKRGNTVVAVEHDRNFMNNADYIVDLGPGAGIHGGKRIYQGTYKKFMSCKASKTAPYLNGDKNLGVKKTYKPLDTDKQLTIHKAGIHNLKDVTVQIPLGLVVGVAGVSGSGKSSLINYTLLPRMKEVLVSRFVNNSPSVSPPKRLARITGTEHIKKCIVVDQRPIGRSKTSSPASYTGIMDRIRALLAATPQAKKQGLTAGYFSVNSLGKCKVCKGAGHIRHHLGFGNFITIGCDTCDGTGYRGEVLGITLNGKNIRDIMAMSVEEATGFFGTKGSPAYDEKISATLQMLEHVGMGYITLGQKTPTISGGEAQRIKLSKELSEQKGRDLLYILDEPTTGLAFNDIKQLIKILDELNKAGNSIIVIEHDPSVLSFCDYIIEMGPGGGNDGGSIIATGTPADLKKNKKSIIGRLLN